MQPTVNSGVKLALSFFGSATVRAISIILLGATDDMIAGDLAGDISGHSDLRGIDDSVATQTHHLGMCGSVGIETGAAIARVKTPHFAPFHQLVERLIERRQRQAG